MSRSTIPWKARRRSPPRTAPTPSTAPAGRPSATSPSSSRLTIRTGAARRRSLGGTTASSRARCTWCVTRSTKPSQYGRRTTPAHLHGRAPTRYSTSRHDCRPNCTPAGSPRRQSGLGRTCGGTAARRSPTASARRCCFATTTSLPTRWVSFVGSSGSCSALRRRRPPPSSCAPSSA